MALPFAATVQAFVSTYLERHDVVESHLTDEEDEAAPDETPPRPKRSRKKSS